MLVVADLDRSTVFYRDRLGFEVRELQPGLVLLESEAMLLYLITHSEPTPDKPGVTLTSTNASDRTSVNLVFRLADCRATYE
jgi:catechol 2,3-dioxygenase-like lactoylglutathione lyase family enzyme